MSSIRITLENAVDFLGAEVEFFYGCGFNMEGKQREEAVVVDYETNRWGTQLIAKTECGALKTISSFTDTGIGTYLVKKGEPRINTNSPWYVPE